MKPFGSVRPRRREGAGVDGRLPRCSSDIIEEMAQVHMTEAQLARDLHAVLERVRQGAEIVVEEDCQPVAVLTAAKPIRRTLSECIALLPADSSATIDEGFAADVDAAIAAHREPLEPPAWD